MDNHEVMALLKIVEMAQAHGTSFVYIRDAAAAQLKEINDELNPAPPAQEPEVIEEDQGEPVTNEVKESKEEDDVKPKVIPTPPAANPAVPRRL